MAASEETIMVNNIQITLDWNSGLLLKYVHGANLELGET
jgi:hypothetical protein